MRSETGPACPGDLRAPLLHCRDGFLWLPRRQFIQCRLDHSRTIASFPEQRHDAQATHLALIIEAVMAVLVAHRVQKALLFPEVQRRDAYPHLLRRIPHAEPQRMVCHVCRGQRSGLCGQCVQGCQRLLNLDTLVGELGVPLVDQCKRDGKIAPVNRPHYCARPLPAIASEQTPGGFERYEVLLRVEAIAARAALGWWYEPLAS